MAKGKVLSAEDLKLRGLVEVKPGVYQKKSNPQPRDLKAQSSCVIVGKKGSQYSWVEINGEYVQVTGDVIISNTPKNIGEQVAIITTIPIKALSINEAFTGRRFKTDKYKIYQKFVLAYLPKMNLGKAPYELNIEFGLSNKMNDIDNGVKSFTDCLVKKYDGFDDRDVYSLIVKKVIVKNGEEYIKFQLKSI